MSLYKNDIRLGVLFALASSIVGSVAMALGKLVAGVDLHTHQTVFLQYLFCLVFTLPYLFRNAKTSRAELWRTERFGTHFIRGSAGWLGFYAMYKGLAIIPLVDGALLRNSAPLFVPLVVWLWVRVAVPADRWWALILGFIGVGLILKPQSGLADISTGHLWGLASGIFLTFSMVGTRLLARTETSITIMFYYFAISVALSLPFAIYYWQPIPPKVLFYLLCLSGSIFSAMWLYTQSYQYAKPSIISPISYFSVVFSGVIGWLFWAHVPSVISILGMLLVIVAGVIAVYVGGKDDESVAE